MHIGKFYRHDRKGCVIGTLLQQPHHGEKRICGEYFAIILYYFSKKKILVSPPICPSILLSLFPNDTVSLTTEEVSFFPPLPFYYTTIEYKILFFFLSQELQDHHFFDFLWSWLFVPEIISVLPWSKHSVGVSFSHSTLHNRAGSGVPDFPACLFD